MDAQGARGPLARGHLPALDGVRGLAILLLLMHQFVLPSNLVREPVRLFEEALQLGWIGVQLFFVLSGFLITGVLLATKGREGYFRAFYVRRVLRIFPLYYLFLVTVCFVLPHVPGAPEFLTADPWKNALFWVYLGNWTREGADVLGSCWSLSVEEQFYLVWPLLVWALDRRDLVRVCLGLAAAALVLRAGLLAAGVHPEIVYENTFTRMDALTLGAAGAAVLGDPAAGVRITPQLRRGLVGTGLALLGVALTGLPRTGVLTQTLGYSLLAVFFTLGIMLAVAGTFGGEGKLARVLSLRPLRVLGTYSYGIYLLQLPLHLYVSRVLFSRAVAFHGDRHYVLVQSVYTTLMVAVVLALAFISYHLYEKRFLSLKRYFQVR